MKIPPFEEVYNVETTTVDSNKQKINAENKKSAGSFLNLETISNLFSTFMPALQSAKKIFDINSNIKNDKESCNSLPSENAQLALDNCLPNTSRKESTDNKIDNMSVISKNLSKKALEIKMEQHKQIINQLNKNNNNY